MKIKIKESRKKVLIELFIIGSKNVIVENF